MANRPIVGLGLRNFKNSSLSNLEGNVAEWSKALELGILISSPKGRGFEPLRCHSRDRSSFFILFCYEETLLLCMFTTVSIKSMPNDYTSMIMNMVYVESFLPSSLGTSHFFHCS